MGPTLFHLTLLASVWFLLSHPDTAQAQGDRLFADDELLEIRLVAPFASVMRERPEEEYVPAEFQYQEPGGDIIKFDVGVRTRGNFRRRSDICRFAPLRLNFKKSQTDDTLFDGQDKLKLVTHCQDSPRYQQSVLSEYLAYRILNLLTDISFRARIVRITYVDTDKKNNESVSLAIILEHAERLEKRIDIPAVSINKITVADLQPEFTNLTSLFHYFIGNTDFSQIASSPDEDCCHNHALFANAGERYYSVPYDFDMSGFVNAPHASPNPRFRLRSVRQRLYRGRCVNNTHVPVTVRRFFDRRNEINALINKQELMTKRTRQGLLSFVDRFYRNLDTPKKIDKQLTRKCI